MKARPCLIIVIAGSSPAITAKGCPISASASARSAWVRQYGDCPRGRTSLFGRGSWRRLLLLQFVLCLRLGLAAQRQARPGAPRRASRGTTRRKLGIGRAPHRHDHHHRHQDSHGTSPHRRFARNLAPRARRPAVAGPRPGADLAGFLSIPRKSGAMPICSVCRATRPACSGAPPATTPPGSAATCGRGTRRIRDRIASAAVALPQRSDRPAAPMSRARAAPRHRSGTRAPSPAH
jgi:hypothetical protein